MKVASRSGFFVFIGGILAARNVVHVRAAFTLEAPPATSMCTDLAAMPISSSAVLAPQTYVSDLLAPQIHLGELLAPQIHIGELISPQVNMGGLMTWLPAGK